MLFRDEVLEAMTPCFAGACEAVESCAVSASLRLARPACTPAGGGTSGCKAGSPEDFSECSSSAAGVWHCQCTRNGQVVSTCEVMTPSCPFDPPCCASL